MPFSKLFYKRGEIYSLFQQAGINASFIEDKNRFLEKIGDKIKNINSHMLFVADVNDKDFDYIFHIYESAGKASLNWLDYIIVGNIPTEATPIAEKRFLGKSKKWWKSLIIPQYEKRTDLSLKKKKGKAIDINWSGDSDLAQRLNSDLSLKEPIIERYQSEKNLVIFEIYFIYYEAKYKYAAIRMRYFYPNSEDVNIANTISQHINAAWFGR